MLVLWFMLFNFSGEGDPVAEDDFDEDYDDDYDSFHQADEESGVQLGTVLPLEGSRADSVLFKNVDWHEWDGGKAGGWPVRWRVCCDLIRLFAWCRLCWLNFRTHRYADN